MNAGTTAAPESQAAAAPGSAQSGGSKPQSVGSHGKKRGTYKQITLSEWDSLLAEFFTGEAKGTFPNCRAIPKTGDRHASTATRPCEP